MPRHHPWQLISVFPYFTVISTMAASFSTCISLLLLTTLFSSLQIHARDSQFFSKVTHFTATTNTNNNDNNNSVLKETEFLKKEEPVNKPEQQPAFIPETGGSYGLYGHESGQFPPTTTTTTYEPYKTESEEDTSKYPNTKYYHYNNDAYNTNQNELTNTKLTGTGYSSINDNNNYNYKKDAYGGYSSMEKQKNNQKYYYNNNNAANERFYYNNDAANDRFYDNNYNNVANDRYYYNNKNNDNAANNRYNGEKQGMSDTRFVEGGKYFYDVNSEKYTHHPTLYGDSSTGLNSGSWENNRGYFGNNNGKSYEHNNSFEKYQNQGEFEEEQEEFEP